MPVSNEQNIVHLVLGAGAGGMAVVDSLDQYLDTKALYAAQLIQAGHSELLHTIESHAQKDTIEQKLKLALEENGIVPKTLELSLVESQSRLGGHVESKTYPGTTFPSELGPEFIHDAYILLMNRLKRSEIKLTPFDQSFAIFYENTQDHITFPPVLKRLKKDSSCGCGCFGCSCPCITGYVQPNLEFAPETLIMHMTDLLSMGELMLDAHHLQAEPGSVMTLEQYADNFCDDISLIPTPTRKKFVSMVLYPLVAASWGITIDEAKSMCAHYALTYLALGLKWYEVEGGLEQSIQTVVESAKSKPNMSIHSGIKVSRLIPDWEKTAAGKRLLGYKMEEQLPEGNVIHDKLYNSVSLGMNLKDLIPVLAPLAEEDSDVARVLELCKRVKYYRTKVVFHRDPAYIPPQHSIVNIHFDGNQRAATTIFKDFHAKKPDGSIDFNSVVLKTWVFDGKPEPKNQLGSKEFEHPLMNIDYYVATQALQSLEERRPDLKFKVVSIAGGFNDANESAIYKGTLASAHLLQSNGLPLTQVLKENQDPRSYDSQYRPKKSDLWLTVQDVIQNVITEIKEVCRSIVSNLSRKPNSFLQPGGEMQKQAAAAAVDTKKVDTPCCGCLTQ